MSARRSTVVAMLAALVLAQSGCSSDGRNTQVIVEVDAEPGVRAMANTLIVRVYGGIVGDPLPSTLVLERPFDVSSDTGRWPRTVALAPLHRNATRIYRFEAAAYREGSPPEGATPVATVRLISGYLRDQTLHVRLVLQDACLGIECEPGSTCDRGLCVDAHVSPDDLGRDAGPSGMDAGVDGGPSCTSETCDDGASCTEDFCMADGTCVHLARDAMCDDGNVCTDDVCVGAGGEEGTGCARTNNTLSCDDGVFCNGEDVCSDGDCTHPGSPCGALVCQESPAACLGCTSSSDCPAASTGPFGVCEGFVDSCDESGTHSATRTTYTCVDSACVPTMDTVTEPCSRTTTGDTCAPSSFGDWGPCSYSSQCALTGSRERTRSDFVCESGSCRSSIVAESELCTRPDGFTCSDGNPCTGPDSCSGGTCVAGPPLCAMDGGSGGCTGDSQCDDGVGCTRDSCNEGTCSNTPDSMACSPPVGCGMAYCDPMLDCQIDSSLCGDCMNDGDCTDADPCTIDHCNTLFVPSMCEHLADPLCGARDGGVLPADGGSPPPPPDA